MNLNDLISKLRIIESNEVAPVHTDGPAEEEGIEIIGGPMGGMMGGTGHSEPPKQQDSVSMNVSLNGAGAQGVRDLMNILHNIEQGVDHTDHSDEHDHNEPIMGDMVDAMADEQMQFQPEQDLEEVQDDDSQTWGNSAYGDSGHHTHDIDSITMHGDDMNSKGSREPHKRQGGGNPYPMNETLVAKLQAHYDSIKEDAGGPINPNAKCNICHTPYAKHFRFDPPGDPTGKRTSTLIRGLCGAVPQNFPDLYSMSESDKKTMSRAAKGVAEGLPQTLRKVVPGYAKREIDKKMDAGKFGKTDADKDANFQRYKKIQDKLKKQGVAEAKEADYGGDYQSAVKAVKAKAEKKPVDMKSLAARMQASYRRDNEKSKVKSVPAMKESQLEPMAACNQPWDGANSPDDTIKAKRDVKMIKGLAKKKSIKEDLYDHEKEDKSVSGPAKKPKMEKLGMDSTTKLTPQAAAVLKGGKTLTGEPRDTIEIDPMMAMRKQAGNSQNAENEKNSQKNN